MAEPEAADDDPIERSHDRYVLSTDPARVDVGVVHAFLSEQAYWALGRDRSTVERSLAHSGVIAGAYDRAGAQVGFGRMVTDLATFAWLCDVFVLDAHRGAGLGTALVDLLVGHPAVAGVKRQVLGTGDAHDLYRRFGFEPLPAPERWMMRMGPGG